jgi:hypothetical protein
MPPGRFLEPAGITVSWDEARARALVKAGNAGGALPANSSDSAPDECELRPKATVRLWHDAA